MGATPIPDPPPPPLAITALLHTGELGGAERSLLGLLAALPREAVTPTLVCPAGEAAALAGKLGVDWREAAFAPMRFGGSPVVLWRSLRAWGHNRRVFRALQLKGLVHAGSHRAALIALDHQGALVMHLRETLGGGLPWRLVRRALRRRAPAVIANSRFSLANLTQGRPWPAPTTVIPNPLDAPAFVKEAREPPALPPGIPPGATVLLMVGNLSPNKGQHRLIQALAQVEDPTLHALLVGGVQHNPELHRYAASLPALAKSLGLMGRVHLLGYQTSAAPYYALADAVVIASEFETFGRVVLEAAAMGKPVLAHDTGGLPDLVRHGETGLLYRGDLGEALTAFLRQRHRWAGWAEEAARRVLPPSQPDAVAATTAAFYREVAARKL